MAMIGCDGRAIPDVLRLLIGCRIRHHEWFGGVCTAVEGPWNDGCYTVVYAHPEDGKPCWINSIRVENGVITYQHDYRERKPLIIEGRERQAQLSLFA
jgi:hypothetical protein